MRYLPLLLFFISCKPIIKHQTYIGGTTILTLLSKDSVWIVADSRRSALENETQNKTTSTICKINYKNGIYYTFSGQLVNAKSSAGFYIFHSASLLENAIDKRTNFDAMFSLFDSSIKTKLLLVCQNDSAQSLKHFKEKFLKKALLEVTITTFINKRLKFISRNYFCFIGSNNRIEILHKDAGNPPILPNIYKTGRHSVIDSFLKRNKAFDLSSKRIKYWGQFLVELEIKNDSNVVGKPINIISFGHDNSPRWVLKNQPCK